MNFCDQTFNSKNNSWEEVRDCCDNVIIYSVHEGKFSCGDAGLELQKRIKQQIEEIKAAEEKLKELKEKAKKFQKEEKLRRQMKEEKKKEKKKERRSKLEKENKEMYEIINHQEEEEKQLNRRINTDTSWIEEQMSQMISETNANISRNINYNATKTIKANTQFQLGK